MTSSWPTSAVLALLLTAIHAVSLALLGASRAGSLLSEALQLASVGLAAATAIRAGARLPGRPGRFWFLLGLGFACWLVGQSLVLVRQLGRVESSALSPADVPFLLFYLPAFAALLPETRGTRGVDWARTLDLAQVGLVLGSLYLYFFLALNLGVDERVITLHFGFLDSYSLLNLLLVGSYLYAWGASRGEARSLYGRMAAIFALYSIGDTLNTYEVVEGGYSSGSWLDLSYTFPFALATVTASRWPAHADQDVEGSSPSPSWRLLPLLPPALVLVVGSAVARRNLDLATLLITSCFLCFAARFAVTQAERGQALARLRGSEAEYRSLVENAPFGIFRYAPEADRFTSVNQALVDMLGYASQDALLAARPSQALFAEPDGRDRLLAYVAAAEPSSGMEAEWRRADGTPLTVRVHARRRAKAADGALAPLEVAAEDITQRKLLEDQLRQALKMEAVGRLAGGVAHDFNNLLMVVTGAAELLRRRLGDTSPHLDQVGMIQKAAADAADLTRQLLAFSRRQTLEPRVLDLNRLVRELGEMLPRLIEERIEQKVLLGADLGQIRADPGQIRQVILNLALNARDSMPGGGQLRLETSNALVDEAFARAHPGLRPGRYVSLSVADTGRGMDPQTRARVFEPFFTTKEKGKGTGLGLATVYGIVKQSGGHIRVESEPGQGSSFTVLLPRLDAPLDPEPVDARPAAPAAAGAILLVEDSGELRAMLRQFLVGEGYAVQEAESAEAALRILRAPGPPIDLVVADVVLPGWSGVRLTEELAGLRPEMPVLLMSGYAEGTAGVAVSAGLTLLQKPVPLDRLAAAIRAKLAGRAP